MVLAQEYGRVCLTNLVALRLLSALVRMILQDAGESLRSLALVYILVIRGSIMFFLKTTTSQPVEINTGINALVIWMEIL